MPCVNLPSGKMQGTASAQTIPARPAVDSRRAPMKIKRSESVVMLQCIVACLFAYLGHPYVGIGIALVKF